MAKKKLLTKRDIQRELLFKINKTKPIAVFLTIFIIVSIPCYLLFVINYADIMLEYRTGVLAVRGHPSLTLFLGPAAIVFLTIVILKLYYIDLYKAKKGKFKVVEEKLYNKKKELISGYHRVEQKNFLYFRCGKATVEDDVYSYSCVGDRFYVVVLRSRKSPLLVYHTRCYEIEDV